MNRTFFGLVSMLSIFSGLLQAQNICDLKEIVKIKKNVLSRRISSYDYNGGNRDYLLVKAGATVEIFKVEGAGVITHIWFTINHQDELSRRNVILRMYWDGETVPSVQSPIGDFFGQGWGEFYNYASLPLAAGPRDGRAMVCYFPMPFSDGARITIENDSKFDIPAFFFYIDYEEHEAVGEDVGRFHAWWNHQLAEAAPEGKIDWETMAPTPNNTTGEYNYLFMETNGAGHFVGVNYYVNSPAPGWFGEGDDMFFIDGEAWPSTLHGTGTEDYFNTSWCPKEFYQHPYFGLIRVNRETGFTGRTHYYRFHLLDPVRFNKSLRATIEHGHNNSLTLELASVAYWYQTEPHKPFPQLESRQARRPLEESNDTDRRR